MGGWRDMCTQRGALNVLHRVEGSSVRRHAAVEDRHNVRVPQRRRQLDLPLESTALPLGGIHPTREQLKRHRPLCRELNGPVNHALATRVDQ